MRESARQREQRKRRKSGWLFGGAGGAIVLVALIAGVVAIANSRDHHRANGCVIADVSESTGVARRDYGTEFSRFATSIGLDGSGDMCVIFAAADPLAESLPQPLFVGPADANKGGFEELPDIERKVAMAREDLEDRLANPPIRSKGSALVEAAVDASQFLEPGDRLLYLSDGLQWTPDTHLSKIALTPSAIARLLAEMEANGLVPDLDGVEISFPYLLYHPGGLDDTQVRRIIAFWEEWAGRAGASISIREPIKQ